MLQIRRWTTFVFLAAALGAGFGFIGAVVSTGHASWRHLPQGVAAKDYVTIGRREAGTGTFTDLTVADFESLKGALAGEWAFADWYTQQIAAEDAGGGQRQVPVRDVSTNFFQVLGVQPALGELFAPQGGVVISHRLWERWYESAEDAIGQAFNLESEFSRTIVGVAPRRFADVFSGQADVWVLNSGTEYAARLGARLHPHDKLLFGTFDEPNGWAALEALAADYRFARTVHVATGSTEATTPTEATDQDRLDATPGLEAFPDRRDETRGRLAWLAVAIVVMLSLIFLALLDSLTAAQESRLRETAVRVAVGASPRHLFLETLLANLLWLAPIAVVAWLTFNYLNSVLLSIEPFATHPGSAPLASQLIGVGAGTFLLVLTFCGSIGWFSYAISRFSRRVGWASPHELAAHRQVQRALLCIAAISLLVAASVAQRYVIDSRHSVGFDLDSAALMPLKRHGVMLTNPESDALALALGATPGIRSAARAELIPLVSRPALPTTRVRVHSPETLHRNLREVHVYRNAVAPTYFDTIGIDLVAGRPIEGPAEVVVSHTLAKHLTDVSSDALGLPIVVESEFDEKKGVYAVVGVAPDVAYHEYDAAPLPIVYQDSSHRYIYDFIIVGLSGDASDLEALVKELDPSLETVSVISFKQMFNDQFAERWSVELVLAASAIFILALALVAVAASFSRKVADAAASIGVRLTVGATAAAVTRLQLRSVVVDLVIAAVLIGGIYAAVDATGTVAVVMDLWLAPVALLLLLAFCALTTYTAVHRIARKPLVATVAQ